MHAREKLYQRAIIFNGGGISVAIFLGMLQAFKDNNAAPDIIIGTCGGGLAAALANQFETVEEQMEVLSSEEMHKLLKKIKISKYGNIARSLSMILTMSRKKIFPVNKKYIIDYPDKIELNGEDNQFRNDFTKTIIVAGRSRFLVTMLGKKRRTKKLWTEIYFTDEDTAGEIQAFDQSVLNSKIASNYEKSYIFSRSRFVTTFTVGDAVRASVSDPLLVSPKRVDNALYVGGIINLYPIELANAIADETIVGFLGEYSRVDDKVLSINFGYRPNQRLYDVFTKEKTTYTVDLSKIPHELLMNPAPKFLKGKMVSKIPVEYNRYVKITKQLYMMGYKRALKALRFKNSRQHIPSIITTPKLKRLL